MAGDDNHGAFWAQKIKTFAHVIDFDKDGKVTKGDYERMAKNYIAIAKLSGDDANEINKKFVAIWDAIFAAAAAKGPVTLDVFVECKRALGKPTLTHISTEIFNACLKLADPKDGFITSAGFANVYKMVELDAKLAPETFKLLDSKKAGKLSSEDFIQAGVDFFNSDDEKSPSKHLFGPLLGEKKK